MPYPKRSGLPIEKGPGVYRITNKINRKMYIGSAVSIRNRLLMHRSELRRNVHENKYLQNAWNKYGEDCFDFDVVQTCPVEIRRKREQHWIDRYKLTEREFGYNIALNTELGTMLGRKHTEETRQYLSEIRKGMDTSAATQAAAIANRGRKRSPESVAKTNKGLTGQKRTPEQVERIRANHWRNRSDASEIAAKSAEKNRGKKHSPEWRAKIAEGNRRRWAKIREERAQAALVAQKKT